MHAKLGHDLPKHGRPALKLVHSAHVPEPRAMPGLTAQDIADLMAWMSRPHLHGYRCVEIDPGGHSGLSHDDRYAVVYERDSSWATWGIARVPDGIMVWDCANGTERGRYANVNEAVAALPVVFRALSRPRDETTNLQQRSNVVWLP